MYNIIDLLKMNLPDEGVDCVVKGKFYYRIEGDDHSCYLSDSDDMAAQIYLSNDLGELVINEDETFGMLVGGEFAYYGVEAEVTGVLKESSNNRYLDAVKCINLKSDLGEQKFIP